MKCNRTIKIIHVKTLLLHEYDYNKFMRTIYTLILLLFTSLSFADDIHLRNYDEFDIPTGTNIPVISLQEFSTAYCEEGDNVSFLTTNDIYLYDKNVIPEGTKLVGYIDEKHEPIIGTHASMKVFVNKMQLKNGEVIPIKAYIYTANNNIIGGGLTKPANYIKIPHYSRRYMFRAASVTQCVPGSQRMMGEHITVSSGANLILVLVEPIHLFHTVIN